MVKSNKWLINELTKPFILSLSSCMASDLLKILQTMQKLKKMFSLKQNREFSEAVASPFILYHS